jgi:diguanylate cyclase
MSTTSLLLTAAAVGSTALTAGLVWGRLTMRTPLATARLQACTDRLTGLANRAGLEAELARRAPGRDPWVLLLVDLDGFKQVNDTYGHAAGDSVLAEVARRLSAAAEPDDLVARIGGDEFVLVAAGELVWTIADHVRLTLRRPMLIAGVELAVTASIGMVQALPGDDARAVLHSADIALYGSKTCGKDQATEFNPIKPLADVEPERPALRWRDLAGARLSGVSDGR